MGQAIPNLGVLQPPFEAYQKSLADLSQFYQSNLQAQQVANFQTQIVHYQLLNENLQKQNHLLDKELFLTEKRFRADSSLSKNKALAPLEADRTEESLLQKKRGLQSAEASIRRKKLTTIKKQLQNDL
ncbi:MAG: hypothetical protein MUE81_15375 [Thermoflexibacter sp.]|nr:hypothetical protein [Thermoflexibacter sp.]